MTDRVLFLVTLSAAPHWIAATTPPRSRSRPGSTSKDCERRSQLKVSVQGRISGATTGAEQGESPCRILVSKRCSMVEARQHPLIPLRAQVRAGNPIFSTGHTFGRVRHHISHAHMEIWRYGDREDRGRRHAAGCRSAEVLHTVHGVEPECASSRASAYAAARGVCVAAGNGGRGD